jgi:16S rRNA (adenine1518-N6/adenine1519-N6)-dimethyltransferase
MPKAKKSLGQNFLTEATVINQIIRAINPLSHDNFLEIGPGKGAITKPLLKLIKNLHVVEIDKDLLQGLQDIQSVNLTIHNQSILHFNPQESFDEKIRIVGNLPYNISTQIMLWSFKYLENFEDMHFMFQKEFGERLVSKKDKKSFGRISVLTQYLTKAEFCFDINPESFSPEPKVESVFIKFIPLKDRSFNDPITQKLQEVTRIAFMHKRKMIGKSLKTIVKAEDLVNLDIDLKARPENLSVEDYVKISETLL